MKAAATVEDGAGADAASSRRFGPVLVAAFITFVAVTALSSAHHELWRDEGDVWLAVRDDSLAGIASRAPHAGTPVLWYAMVKPLAELGLSPRSMAGLHLVIASSTAFLILFFSPFAPVTRIGIVFSYFLSYEWAVISRNYAVGAALLITLALVFRNPGRILLSGFLLAALVNTSVHALAIGLVLYSGLIWRVIHGSQRSWRAGLSLLIATVGLITAVVQLYPRSGGQFDGALIRHVNLEALRWAFEGMIAPGRIAGLFHFEILGVLLVVTTAAGLQRHLRTLFVASVLLLLGIFVLAHAVEDGYRHYGFLWLLVVLFRWWDAGEGRAECWVNRAADWSFGLSLASLLVFSLHAHVSEIREPFSGSAQTSEFILRRDLLLHDQLAVHPSYLAGSILPLLPPDTVAWFPSEERFGTFSRWDAAMARGSNLSQDAVLDLMARDCTGTGVILVTNTAISADAQPPVNLLFVSDQPRFGRRDERFFVYTVTCGDQINGAA